MALTIRNPKAEKLARELSSRTGEPLDLAVETALRERLDRTPSAPQAPMGEDAMAVIRKFQHRLKAMPVHDHRPPNELLGYDERGLWE